jgi:hypothetical protein
VSASQDGSGHVAIEHEPTAQEMWTGTTGHKSLSQQGILPTECPPFDLAHCSSWQQGDDGSFLSSLGRGLHEQLVVWSTLVSTMLDSLGMLFPDVVTG